MAKDKANRPKARLPRGFADRSPAEIRRTADMLGTIRTVYEKWGFEPVETPLIEYADALGKFLPDEDRPNEGVFAFQDDDEQWLSLRYDLTAPLARMVAENYDRLPKPYKSYRSGWVFRNEKPGPGRFRQFMQFDADIVGAASPLADAEICMMAADTMEALGFERGEYVIKVSSRGVLDGLFQEMEKQGAELSPQQRLKILRAVDKFDRLGSAEVMKLLGPGRIDESGDETEGAQLSDRHVMWVMETLGLGERFAPSSSASNLDIVEGIASGFRKHFQTSSLHSSLEAVRLMADAFDGSSRQSIRIDPSVVRGLEYYTGPVFEAELTFDILDEDGRPQKFGSVGGGGRYDGLVGRFRGQDVPATGFSVGVSRLAAALDARDKAKAKSGPIIVTVMDRDNIGEYQRLTKSLREALNANGETTPVEMYIGDSGMKAQLKYADRRNAPCVIIQGSEERANNKVQIKDLAAGKQASAEIDNREEWIAARPAQQEVDYDGDVSAIAAAVRAILPK